MSQGTNNQSALLSVDDNYFDTQSTHFANASYSQWPMQGSRTMASSIPSPTTSIQTSMTAPPAPMQRSPSYLGMSNSNRAQRHHRVHPSPNLGLLAPPGHFSRPNIDPGTGTFDRFYDDGPWSSERLRAPTIVPNRASQSNANFQMYRDDVVSEIDSIARSDSGYHTHYARSIISNEPEHMNQELPTDITVPMGNINVNSAASSEPTEIFPLQSDQASQYSGRSGRGKEFRCSDCGEMSKCKSDHKKHMLKHQKPFKCDIRNCRRKGKGFTTINDLLRHKKSVHRVGQYQNSYQCASENCRNKAKIWPRLDNFKQHIQRMHKEEDEQELINRSMYTPTETKTPTDISMDPTLIAGIGTEKQFPNDLEDPTVGISLTPEQDPSPWTTMNANPGGFALDVHPPLPRLIIPGSGSEIIETSKSHPRLGAHSLSPRTQHQPESFQSDSTSMLSNRKPSVSRSSMDKRPRLSSAPQTKVEQQQKQHQLSKNMQASSPAVSNELEDRVLQILCGATGPRRREEKSSLGTPSTSNESGVFTLTKQELLSVSQSISNLFKQNKKTLNVPRRSSRSGSSGPIMCELCGVTLARSCDMKKHMKRHTRPYGCTYPRCHKRFGAKSDWKRHENSQHYQQEFFRCQRLSLFTGTLCADLFPREQDFSRHLEKDHKLNLSKKEFQCEISECRIGRNYQCQFWCGFCEKIVKLNEERNAAWDERFDHIDSHFNKEKKRIENWLCMDAKKKKGEVYRDIESSKHVEEESEASGGGEPDETPSPDAPGARQNVQEDVQMQNNSNPTTSAADLMATYTSEVSRKRRAPEVALSHSSSSTKRQRVSLSRYCCLCNNGPWEYSTYGHCILCGHELCTTCMAINDVATEGIE